MNQPPKPGRTGPPHNPGVRELVAGKRRDSSPPKREDAMRGFRGWHERGYLPHRDEPGLTQFVTFHLADSYPAALRSEWAALLQVEDDRERHLQLEAWLDQGHGACQFRRPEIAQLVDDAFRFYHGQRYDLRAWVVMPNHIHALFQVGALPLGKIIGQFNLNSAVELNRREQRQRRVNPFGSNFSAPKPHAAGEACWQQKTDAMPTASAGSASSCSSQLLLLGSRNIPRARQTNFWADADPSGRKIAGTPTGATRSMSCEPAVISRTIR